MCSSDLIVGSTPNLAHRSSAALPRDVFLISTLALIFFVKRPKMTCFCAFLIVSGQLLLHSKSESGETLQVYLLKRSREKCTKIFLIRLTVSEIRIFRIITYHAVSGGSLVSKPTPSCTEFYAVCSASNHISNRQTIFS